MGRFSMRRLSMLRFLFFRVVVTEIYIEFDGGRGTHVGVRMSADYKNEDSRITARGHSLQTALDESFSRRGIGPHWVLSLEGRGVSFPQQKRGKYFAGLSARQIFPELRQAA